MCRLQKKFKILSISPGRFKQTEGDGLTREQQHFAVRAMFSYLTSQIDSGEIRHHDIGNEEIWSLNADRFQSLEWIAKGCGVESVLTQNHCQSRCDDLFVIDNHDTQLFVLGDDLPPFGRTAYQPVLRNELVTAMLMLLNQCASGRQTVSCWSLPAAHSLWSISAAFSRGWLLSLLFRETPASAPPVLWHSLARLLCP